MLAILQEPAHARLREQVVAENIDYDFGFPWLASTFRATASCKDSMMIAALDALQRRINKKIFTVSRENRAEQFNQKEKQ